MKRTEINNPIHFAQHLCDRASSIKRDLDRFVDFHEMPLDVDYHRVRGNLDQVVEILGRIGARMEIEDKQYTPQAKVNPDGLDEDKQG